MHARRYSNTITGAKPSKNGKARGTEDYQRIVEMVEINETPGLLDGKDYMVLCDAIIS